MSQRDTVSFVYRTAVAMCVYRFAKIQVKREASVKLTEILLCSARLKQLTRPTKSVQTESVAFVNVSHIYSLKKIETSLNLFASLLLFFFEYKQQR